MEIKEQTQVFITVPYYFRQHIIFGKISELLEKTFLERAYLLDGWIFCVQCGNVSEEMLRKYIENQG